MDRSLIESYAAGGPVPASAIEGLSAAELNWLPPDGSWSIQQIVVHLLESDLIASHRMKRVAAEENPLLIGYDETRFARLLHYDRMDIALVCEVFAGNRRLTAELLRLLPDEAFARTGVHNERGKVSLAEMVRMYADHVGHHLAFIERKRVMLGKSATAAARAGAASPPRR